MNHVWSGDETREGDLVCLGMESLIVASPDKEEVPRIRAALEAGESPAAVLSGDSRRVDLSTVVRVSTDRNDKDIDVFYKDGREIEEEMLFFSSPQKRDEVFAALRQTFAGKFEEFEEALSRPQAMFYPLMALTIFGFLTFVLAAAAGQIAGADELDIAGRNQGVKALITGILGAIGPVGVWVVGGLITAFCALAVYGAAKEPPVMLTLQEPPYKRKSKLALKGKYALLLAVWGYFLVVVFNRIQSGL